MSLDQNRIVIFGNSGSGKSTLARSLSEKFKIEHLDLDTVAWSPNHALERQSLLESHSAIEEFMQQSSSWVIEGCYSSLLERPLQRATEVFFLNPGEEACVDHCRNRPWEPHKYASLEEQNQNLEMLLDWVRLYSSRTDEFSLKEHQKLFEQFSGKKTELIK